MKICFLADGQSVHTERWCQYFLSAGHEVHLITLRNTDLDGVHFHFIDAGNIASAGGNWKIIFKFRKVKSLVKKIKPDIQPDPENGTVNINYELETKGSDQVEFSAGWGSTGIVGSIGLKFSNFAIQNLFKPETYRIVPQGEGQTLTLNGRTNGQSYTSVSLSFLEPWLGGKRPNSLSASIYYSAQATVSDRYSSNYSNYINQMYSGYGGGYGGG